MSARAIPITADGTYPLGTIDAGHTGVFIGVTAGSSLGGGTISIVARPGRSSSDYNIAVDTMVAGDEWEYVLGAGMEVEAVVAGATSPTIKMVAAPTS
jgi:hypothetical protein